MFKLAIVDDTTLMRKSLSALCQTLGLFVLFQASNGKEMQDLLSTAAVLPDIILMDIEMPVVNGIEATSFVTSKYPSVKILALSIFSHEKHIVGMLKNGARGYLLKSVEPEEFLSAIEKVMEGEIYISQDIIKQWKIPQEYLQSVKAPIFKTYLLSEREYEFLKYCATDLSYKEIALKMNVQYKTVDTYRSIVTHKLNIFTRAGLAAYAVRNGLS